VTSDLAHSRRFVSLLSGTALGGVPVGATNREEGRSTPARALCGQDSSRKSHAFKILTYKIFVMNILRGIPQIIAGNLLIPDILQK
jgi:hypothetical protein